VYRNASSISCLECSSVSALITAHDHHSLSDRCHAVVGKYDGDGSAERVSSGEGGNALIRAEKSCHVSAKIDRRTRTKRSDIGFRCLFAAEVASTCSWEMSMLQSPLVAYTGVGLW